jgi:hypothetical protein
MNRLDDVCGAAGWQCEYPHAGGKTICSIGIKIDGEWVWKADGAGDTDVEAEKGAISDAFKRAAVKWGIGRYLYDLDAPWVPCETYESGGKKRWSKWKEDPWKYVKSDLKATFPTAKAQSASWEKIRDEMISCEDEPSIDNVFHKYRIEFGLFKRNDREIYNQLVDAGKTRKLEIQQENLMKEQLKGVK